MFRFSLAQALVAEGRGEEALPHYRMCIEKKADWMMARILLGKLLLQLGRREEARPWLEGLQVKIPGFHLFPARDGRPYAGRRRIHPYFLYDV